MLLRWHQWRMSESYINMNVKHGDATHIIIAYHLDGLNKAYDEDYLDVGDSGCKRRLLKILVDKLTSTMLVVARYYGGVHLAARHFEILVNLANKALKVLKDGPTHSRFKLNYSLESRGLHKRIAGSKQRACRGSAL